MGNIMLFFTALNCVAVSSLLWLITFLGSYLYDPKEDYNRGVHFECGFYSVNKAIPKFNLNFIVSAIFLILYDVELVLLIPALFNLYNMHVVEVVGLCVFCFSMLFSLLLDVETESIKWYFS